MNKSLSLIFVLLVGLSRSNATSVLDSFNDLGGSGGTVVNGTPLATFLTAPSAGGIGFTTGYEQPTGMVPVARTNDLTVSLTNYVSGQSNSEHHWSVAATLATSGAARRTMTRGTATLSAGVIWFSFIASLENPNGDVALTFNGTFSGTGQFGAGAGMRVGLGHPTRPGALGVGPVASQGNLTTIIDGVNGAITTNGFVPTDGTPGLVLGRISIDSQSSFPKVEIWYNPDVPNEASLPAPTLTFIDNTGSIVPVSITRLGYQVNRTSPAAQNEVIDNVKLSDEPNGFDIVYKAAPLPLPVLDVSGETLIGSETGPTNIVFNISSDRILGTPLTVTYRISGVASNGFDGFGGFVDADYSDANFNPETQISSVTIPAGQTNAIVTLTVLDDAIPEGDESVVISLDAGSEYLLGIGSASGVILDNNDANVSVQYMFTQTTAAQVWDPHLTASGFNVAGVAGGYSTTPGYFISENASIRARGDVTPANALDAVANGNYMSFSVSPIPGYGLTLTNLQLQALYGNYLFLEPGAALAGIVVRSSLDNFTTDLVTWELQPDTIIFPAWYDLSLPLGDEFSNLISGVEFRLYIYDDTTQNQVGVRVDNLYLSGETFVASGAQQVSVTATNVNAAEPATPGEFIITRVGETTNSLTVDYAISGTASSGVDFVALPGSVTIPAGQSNVIVTVTPIDDELVEPLETVTLTILTSTNYGIVSSFSATVTIADDADVGGLAGYMFNESNNGAPALSAVAAVSTRHPEKINALNAVAGAGLGNFGANNLPGVGHGYATSVPHSAPSSFFCRGDYLSTSAGAALAEGDYVSFTIAPAPGHVLTLTNFIAHVKLVSAQTNVAFLRSSVDGFASDLDSISVPGGATDAPYIFWSVPLTVENSTGPVEFRIYFYSVVANVDILRLDDVAFQGSSVATSAGNPTITGIAVASETVTINFAGEPDDLASAFKLQSSPTLNGVYATEDAAVITGGGGVFQATIAVNGETRFYRIFR